MSEQQTSIIFSIVILGRKKVSPDKMVEMQAKIEEERRALEAKLDMEEEERNKARAELEKREKDLLKAQWVIKLLKIIHCYWTQMWTPYLKHF